MRSRTALVSSAAAVLVGLLLGACASSVKLSSEKMCTAAGGTYSANMCNSGTANQRTAVQMCQTHGGIYDSVLDMCEIPGSSK